jgi:hypothetical protein
LDTGETKWSQDVSGSVIWTLGDTQWLKVVAKVSRQVGFGHLQLSLKVSAPTNKQRLFKYHPKHSITRTLKETRFCLHAKL